MNENNDIARYSNEAEQSESALALKQFLLEENNNFLDIQSLLESISQELDETQELLSTGQVVDFTPLHVVSFPIPQNKRLDVYQASNANNTPVILFQANGQNNQKWEMVYNTRYRGVMYKALHSNKYMGVLNGSTDAEAPIVQQDLFLNDARQVWTTEAVDNDPGRQIVRNLKSNLVLDVKGAEISDETPLIQFPRNLQLNQQFAIRVL
jgi:hypothetical protein